MTWRLKILFAFLIISHLSLNAQNDSTSQLSSQEVVLSRLFKACTAETSVYKRDSLNSLFAKQFKQALSAEVSFNYPFDSLKHIGKLISNDKIVRIYTWNIPQTGGLYSYFGFIQVRKDNGEIALFELKDSRKEIEDPNNEKLSAEKWMGALYYQIADININAQTYYVLLGFDFNNLFTSKKIIETLTINSNGNPIFGLPVLNVDNKVLLSRIVFEYSARVVFTLKYNSEQQMIIFDHLSPSKPEYAGDFQFYGPDSSFDGFKLETGKWIYVRDLDLRNPRREKPKPIDAPEKLPEPSFIYKPLYGKTI